MKRSSFRKKSYEEVIAKGTGLKRAGFARTAKLKPKTRKVRVAGQETAKELKKDIQAILREIVMLRDKKCILYGIKCNHEIGVNDEGIVWQAEHLVERSNSATYADLKLVVLVCKNCHGWKHFTKSNHDQYDRWVKTKLSPDRVAHWDRCCEDSWRATKVDWKLTKLALEQDLNKLKNES